MYIKNKYNYMTVWSQENINKWQEVKKKIYVILVHNYSKCILTKEKHFKVMFNNS